MSILDIETHDNAAENAYENARATFERMWSIGNEPPPGYGHADPVDAMQVRLNRWQLTHFGPQPDAMFALGVIEELGETFDADDHAESAIDGLGDVIVFASQLAFANRLAIGPIIDLGRVYTKHAQAIVPLRSAAMLAQTIRQGAQGVRGLADRQRYRERLVRSIGACIAKALDDVEIIHSLDVNARKVFVLIGEEVLARGAGHDAIPVVSG